MEKSIDRKYSSRTFNPYTIRKTVITLKLFTQRIYSYLIV